MYTENKRSFIMSYTYNPFGFASSFNHFCALTLLAHGSKDEMDGHVAIKPN